MIRARLNEEFHLTLDSNPTTGYRWEAKFDSDRLRLAERSFKPSRPGALGSGGVEMFSFVPIKPGETEVSMVYKRPWEAAELERKSFQVMVTG